jgi:hypothetical protein
MKAGSALKAGSAFLLIVVAGGWLLVLGVGCWQSGRQSSVGSVAAVRYATFT